MASWNGVRDERLDGVRFDRGRVNPMSMAALRALRDQYTLSNLTEDVKEGVAAFRERRKPRFRGK
jgi:enoyl-CoA hydratase/carnithine racemase